MPAEGGLVQVANAQARQDPPISADPANEDQGGWRFRGTSAEVEGRDYPIARHMVIGRDPSADIVISKPQISRRHAEIEVLGEHLSLRDLGSTNGTYVNGAQVSEAILSSGDIVRFDLVEFEVLGPDADPELTLSRVAPTNLRQALASHERARLSEPRLVVRSGTASGRRFPLIREAYTIGRTMDNDIVIEDASISRRHARLVKTQGGWRIEDLESTNGIRINGEEVIGGQVYDGDRIRLGLVRLKFEAPPQQQAPRFDPSATVQTRAVKRPSRFSAGVMAFGALGVALLVLGGWWLWPSDEVVLDGAVGVPTNAPLQAVKIWERRLANGRKHPATPVIADLNGDRYLDLVVADTGGFLLALDGEEGKRIFELDLAGRVLAPTVAADLSGEGVADIVVAGYDGMIYALNGKAQLLWRTVLDRGYGTVVGAPALHDITGDGLPDVILPTTRKGLVALDGSRGWELWSTAQLELRGAMTAPMVADLNGDGSAELVTTTDDGWVWAVSAKGRKVWKLWSQQLASPSHGAPTSIATAEGPLVVVATEKHGIFGLFGKSGLVSWRAEIDAPFVASPIGVQAGKERLVLAVSAAGEAFGLDGGNGERRWQRQLGAEVQATPAFADLTGDGRPETLILDAAGGLTVLDILTGNPVYETALVSGTGYVASPVLGDVNRNGRLDLIAAAVDGRISAFEFNSPSEPGVAVWPQFAGSNSHLVSGD